MKRTKCEQWQTLPSLAHTTGECEVEIESCHDSGKLVAGMRVERSLASNHPKVVGGSRYVWRLTLEGVEDVEPDETRAEPPELTLEQKLSRWQRAADLKNLIGISSTQSVRNAYKKGSSIKGYLVERKPVDGQVGRGKQGFWYRMVPHERQTREPEPVEAEKSYAERMTHLVESGPPVVYHTDTELTKEQEKGVTDAIDRAFSKAGPRFKIHERDLVDGQITWCNQRSSTTGTPCVMVDGVACYYDGEDAIPFNSKLTPIWVSWSSGREVVTIDRTFAGREPIEVAQTEGIGYAEATALVESEEDANEIAELQAKLKASESDREIVAACLKAETKTLRADAGKDSEEIAWLENDNNAKRRNEEDLRAEISGLQADLKTSESDRSIVAACMQSEISTLKDRLSESVDVKPGRDPVPKSDAGDRMRETAARIIKREQANYQAALILADALDACAALGEFDIVETVEMIRDSL